MSDCSKRAWRAPKWEGTEWRDPQPVLHLKAVFDKGQPWEYSIALNGRRLQSFYIEGERQINAPVIDWDDVDDGR